MTPDPLNRLVAQLAKLPGIGEKTAQRLAFHVLRAPADYARGLAGALLEVIEKVRLCPRCLLSKELGALFLGAPAGGDLGNHAEYALAL